MENSQDGVPLIALEPEQPGEFRANVVVTAEVLPEGYDADAWHEMHETALPEHLANFLLLDHEHIALDGRPGLRRLVHHAHSDTGSVTMEQWATVDNGIGYILTASTSSLTYDLRADLFSEIAENFRLEGPAAHESEGTP